MVESSFLNQSPLKYVNTIPFSYIRLTHFESILIAIGFRNPTGPRERFPQKYERLSEIITREHPFRKIGIRKIELDDMDEQALYAMAGFWVRKLHS